MMLVPRRPVYRIDVSVAQKTGCDVDFQNKGLAPLDPNVKSRVSMHPLNDSVFGESC